GKMLASPPYNGFARAVVSESLGILRWRQRRLEQAVEKLTSGDAGYKGILRDAPARAFADWEKLTAPWKAELERSESFELKLSQPSRKAVTGCAAELYPDTEKLIRAYEETTYSALVNRIVGDPVMMLLLDRLAVCTAVEKVWGASGALRDLVRTGR